MSSALSLPTKPCFAIAKQSKNSTLRRETASNSACYFAKGFYFQPAVSTKVGSADPTQEPRGRGERAPTDQCD
jgi:hypothetical protein